MPEIKRTRLRTKQDLIDDSRDAANALFRSVNLLPDEVWTEPTDAAGWNIRDHLAHVAWWDSATTAQMKDGISEQVTLQISDVVWSKGIDAINEVIREKSGDTTPDDVRAFWLRTQDALLTLLASWPERTYQEPARQKGFVDEGETRLIDVLADYLGKHYREHQAYIDAISGQRLIDLGAVL